MMTRTWLLALMFLAAAPASGERLSIPVGSASVVETRAGEAQVLLSLEFLNVADYAITRAFLEGASTTAVEEPLDVWVRASQSGTAIPHVLGRTSIHPRSQAVTCDLTGLVQAARGEAGIDGLILSLPDWRGEDLPEAVAEGLRTALAGGTLEVECRRLLRPPPRP